MIFATKNEVYCNARTVVYPDGSSLVMVSDRAIFRRPGFVGASSRRGVSPDDHVEMLRVFAELADPELEMKRLEREGKTLADLDGQKISKLESQKRSMRRAKAALRDYVKSNDWDFFVTLTLDPSRIDRYDVGDVVRKMSQWADNQVRRHGLAYVLVPELHKDGAIHFHGFFHGDIRAVDSGTLTREGVKKPRRPRSAAERERMLRDGWQIVNNLPGWTLGFTTAIRPYGDVDAAAAYITKYITKEAAITGKIGGRWYYSGGDLRRPDVTFGEGDADAAAQVPGAWDGTVPGLGARLVMYRTGPDGSPINGTTKEHNNPNSGMKGGESDSQMGA